MEHPTRRSRRLAVLVPITFGLALSPACSSPESPSTVGQVSSAIVSTNTVSGATPPQSGPGSSAPPTVTLTFMSSDPASGSTVIVGAGANGTPASTLDPSALALTFQIASQTALTNAMVQVSLLDPSGSPCASIYTAGTNIAANT